MIGLVLAFIAGALVDHYFEAKVRAWFGARAAAAKAALTETL